jgi:rod shape-determining protein MreB and related proteins
MPNLGIDLGTANTLVYLAGKGLVYDEPTAIAFDETTNSVIGYGRVADEMIGRTPPSIRVVKPLSTGVVSDYGAAQLFLSLVMKQTIKRSILSPYSVVIGVPSRISGAEFKAMQDALSSSRIAKIWAVQEPVAAAIGAGLDFTQPRGCLVIDIGAGTTDIAMLSLGRVVQSRSIKIGAEALVNAFISHLNNEIRLNVGEKTAQAFLQKYGQAFLKNSDKAIIQGIDMTKGLPVNKELSPSITYEAIEATVSLIVTELKLLLDAVPPDLASDILNDGIHLTGGGSLLNGLAELISEKTGIPCQHVPDPLLSVVNGCGIISEDVEKFKFILEAAPRDPNSAARA